MSEILVSQRWSGRHFTQKNLEWTATESYDVCGVSNPEAAKSAIPVSYGAAHPDNSFMLAQNISAAENKGPLAWIVTVEYNYQNPGNGAENPLNQPYILDWDFSDECFPVDRDLDGNPIVNS